MQHTPAQAQIENTSASAAWECVEFLESCRESEERTEEKVRKLREASMGVHTSRGCQERSVAFNNRALRYLINQKISNATDLVHGTRAIGLPPLPHRRHVSTFRLIGNRHLYRNHPNKGGCMTRKPKTVKAGHVRKIIKPIHPSLPEQAEIEVDEADHLYREIRIENALENEQGQKVKLKEHADVDVVIEADPKATTPAK
jgi:hypothetical protein